ncbi:Uncharacterised protein [Streptococcus gallolyticus]|uniref:Uncharacterized protein n=1 Tax=Streptococcus gallolyticus TaxID=315405 RepID=A0AA94M1G8_9STRE|nr:Uncharacterised protein [Streptococcus gallolyticus]
MNAKERIQKAFWHYYQEKPIDQIRIRELTEKRPVIVGHSINITLISTIY